MTASTNIVWHESEVTKVERQRAKGHKSAVLWFTGLISIWEVDNFSRVGNSTAQKGIHTYRLDGDNVRYGLNKNLGFSPEDRTENIRRIGEVSKLMVDAGLLTLTAFISPYREDRDQVRELVEPGEFIEVYVKASLETCEERDPKGFTRKPD